MPNIGPPELIIILVILLLLFGARKIPELARGLGSGVREFRRSSSGKYDEVESAEKKDEEEPEEKLRTRSEAAARGAEEGSGEPRTASPEETFEEAEKHPGRDEKAER